MMVESRVNELSWSWIAFALIVPSLLGLLVAAPFWWKSQMILGNIAGTALIFTSAFALIWREYVELDRVVQGCIDAGTVCWPTPSAFSRFALYASIGLV